MKELRGKVIFPSHRGGRMLYAFDSRGTTVLLIGGDKKVNPNWDDCGSLFDDHLKQIERDEKKREEKKRGKEFS